VISLRAFLLERLVSPGALPRIPGLRPGRKLAHFGRTA